MSSISTAMPSDKQNKRMPVRIGQHLRKTVGHSSSLQRSMPQNVVKTPQGLRLVPAKRNILGQCLKNEPVQPRKINEVPSKIARPIYYSSQSKCQPLKAINTNVTQNKTPGAKIPTFTSPLVPLEEYEKHYQSQVNNVGVFQELTRFCTRPTEPSIPCLQSVATLVDLSSTRQNGTKKEDNYVAQTLALSSQTKCTLEGCSIKKVSKQEPWLGQGLIPIPNSPFLLTSGRVASGIVAPRKFTISAQGASDKENDVIGSCVIPVCHSTGEICTFDSNFAFNQECGDKSTTTMSQEMQQCNSFENVTLNSNPILDGAQYKSTELGYYNAKHSHQNKGNSSCVSQSCSSNKPKTPEYPIKSQVNQNLNEAVLSHAKSYLEHEQMQLSLFQEHYNIQKQQMVLQEQQTILQEQQTILQKQLVACQSKIVKFQEEKIICLQNLNDVPSQNHVSIVENKAVQCEIHFEPPTQKRRSGRLLSSQSRQNADVTQNQLETTSNNMADKNQVTATIPSMGVGNSDTLLNNITDSMQNVGGINSTKRRASQRKSIVEYGQLRSSFNTLLQTPTLTPCTGKSGKKLRTTIRNTPSQVSKNVMKQLKTLYEDT